MTDIHRTYPTPAAPTPAASTPAAPTPAAQPEPESAMAPTMRALAQDRYGHPVEVLRVREVPTPRPAPGQVLLQVAAAALNPFDWHVTTGTPYFMRLLFGLRGPGRAIRGADVVGRVLALGDGVTGPPIGARVAGIAIGSFAERALADSSRLAVVPDSLTDADAAALPMAGVTALLAVRDHGRVAAGQRVLVVGAAGGVGGYAAQLAVAAGAEVVGVCGTANVELVRSYGVSRVIDHTRGSWADGAAYDVILDAAGTAPLRACRRALRPGGSYVMIGGPKANPWLDPLTRIVAGPLVFAGGSRRFRQFTAAATTADLALLMDEVVAGRLRPVVTRTIALPEVPAALAAFAAGRARGKVVVDIAEASS